MYSVTRALSKLTGKQGTLAEGKPLAFFLMMPPVLYEIFQMGFQFLNFTNDVAGKKAFSRKLIKQGESFFYLTGNLRASIINQKSQ